jgi:predicted permease
MKTNDPLSDLDADMQHHIEQQTQDNIERGMTPEEARYAALRKFGNVTLAKEDTRAVWVPAWLDQLRQDVRQTVRTLRRAPGFTATALVSLTVGIGANAAIFSLIDQVALRDLPVLEPARLVLLDWNGSRLATGWGSGNLMSYPICRDLQEQQSFFDGVFCRHPTDVNFSTGQQHERVRAEIVSGSYFPVLGARARLGRLIAPSDDLRPGAHPVAVLSYRFWQTRFAGAEDVVGQRVLVNNYPMTVIGVAPAEFVGVDPLVIPALWLPAMMTEQAAQIDANWNRLLDRRAVWMHVFGRLKSGTTAAEAKAGLQPWFKSMLVTDMTREGFPIITPEQRRTYLASTIDVLPAARGLSGLRRVVLQPLWVLMSGTVLLLLLASLNVAGLVLARGAARRRELSTRLALGATRGRITRQLLVESVLLTLVGGLLGLAAAPAVSHILLQLLSPEGDISFRLDYRVLVFTFLASILAGGLCGLVPAFRTGRLPLIAALTERSRISAHESARLQKMIVAGQMAFALILLIGAGLFVQTLAHLHERVGFASGSLVMLSVDPPSMGYSESDAERVMREIFRRVQEVPGVERAAIGNAGLLTGSMSTTDVTIELDGQRIVSDGDVSRMRIGPRFFSTLGTPVIAGREFDERDVRAPGNKPTRWHAAIVNESFARRYFRGRSPVGSRLGVGDRPDTATDIEIIGVVRDFSRRTLRDRDLDQVFFQFWDQNSGDGTFYLRIRGSAAAFPSLRAAVRQVDPALPVSLTTFDDQIDRSLRTERMLATLSSGFGTFAVLLSVVGLYGVMAFIVTQRRQEIGVRLALGATRTAAVWLVIRDASMLIAGGTVVALFSAWALRRLIEGELFGVGALDVPTIALASCLLAIVALSAAMIPAWRAASVSPTEAMRVE